MHELIHIKTGERVTFASEVDELSRDEYTYFLKLALKYFQGEIVSVQAFKQLLFQKLTKLKVSFKMNFYSVEERDAIWSALSEKIDLLDSFFEITEDDEGQKNHRLKTESITNLLRVWGDFEAPKDLFNELSWGDFVVCMNAQKMLFSEGEKASIEEITMWQDDIFRALYKPVKRGAKLANRDRELIYYHAHNYISYLAYLITTTPISVNGELLPIYEIWQSNEDDEKIIKPSLGWNNVLFSVAETGVFGDAEQVNKQPFINVLLFLYKQKKDSKTI